MSLKAQTKKHLYKIFPYEQGPKNVIINRKRKINIVWSIKVSFKKIKADLRYIFVLKDIYLLPIYIHYCLRLL